jgi:hypothetical protein
LVIQLTLTPRINTSVRTGRDTEGRVNEEPLGKGQKDYLSRTVDNVYARRVQQKRSKETSINGNRGDYGR